ncbi:hypothetical protein, partial [Desulfonatronum sp. SC1]|uniref:hypothetical protein n=1 Tax=Desulfonatronum sp. SC1 TaxID=2109626 RepID=UPI001E2B9985
TPPAFILSQDQTLHLKIPKLKMKTWLKPYFLSPLAISLSKNSAAVAHGEEAGSIEPPLTCQQQFSRKKI